jgi:hypothetical protein
MKKHNNFAFVFRDKEASSIGSAAKDCSTSVAGNSTEKSNPLSKENSAQTLSQLRATHSKLVSELNSFPVRSNTLRMQNRRREIDSQLDKVEALIAALTKPF